MALENAPSGSPTRCTSRPARFAGTSGCTSGTPIAERRLHVDDGGQRLVAHLDELRGVLGDVAVLRDHERDHLAHVADAVGGERPLGARLVRPGCGMRSGEGWLSSPSSAAVSTRWTPGSARARVASIETMRAWPCGLRRPAAYSIPSRWTSSTKQPSPRSSRGSSLRGMRAPIIRVVMAAQSHGEPTPAASSSLARRTARTMFT